MTTDEAHEALKHIPALREAIDKLEFRALKVIACDKPTLKLVPKTDRYWRYSS